MHAAFRARILVPMEELKACLFCGRYIDRTFRYCPHCGYEFAQEDEGPDPAEEAAGAAPWQGEPAAEQREGDSAGPPVPGTGTYYLLRLKDIEKLLIEMEHELDLIISESPPAGALTTSSRDP